MRVLIVEDEAIIAIGYEATLIEAGCEVVGIAASAPAAFALAEEHRPDMAFIDMNLADGLTGNAIAAGLHDRYGLRYVLITGNPELVDHQVLERSAGLLRKPVSHRDLKGMLGRAARHPEKPASPGLAYAPI